MAIPKTIRLEFVTPVRQLATEDVDEVQLPGEDGFFGVLPGHAPLAEVVPDRVSVLAPVAESAEEIDRARAESAKRRAEERLQKAVPEVDFERARMALIRSIGRLDASKYARSRR